MPLLREPSDRRTLLFVAATLGLAYTGWARWDAVPTWVLVPWVLFTAWMSWLSAVITHNTIHAPLFRARSLNRAFQLVLTLAYGHPVSAFVPGHNLSHHCHTQSRRDVMRTTKMRFRWNLLNLVLAPAVLARDITRADLSYARAMRTERPRWFRQWVAEWAVFACVQGVLLVLDWRGFLLFQLLPHAVAGAGIVGMNHLQHDGCDQAHPFNHSRNFVGRWINWWTFNNGYHTIHHMDPGLHWSKAAAAHAERVAPRIHPNLDQPSMLAYIWRAYVSPGVRTDYLGRPLVLPDEGPDEDWIPGVGNTPAQASLGAEG
jgi:fatty acid desaturase